MAKYSYKIIFNEDCSDKRALVYYFGNTHNIKLSVSKGRAVVWMNMTVKKNKNDFINLDFPVFKDAYRKILLCHVCKYGSGLKVKNIKVVIDNDEFCITGEDTDMFPLMFSMIPDKSFNLNAKWSNELFINKIISSNKTNSNEDFRFAAMYSYLQSKGREYVIDRFTGLWVSMNAYYNYSFQNAKNTKRKSERNKINNLVNVLGYRKLSKDKKTIDKAMVKLVYTLPRVSISEYKLIYDFAESKEVEINNHPVLKPFTEASKELDIDLFTLILFEFPYYLRCKYFHGNKCTLLISGYNDYEIMYIGMINYFLDRFLDERIPSMFIEEDIENENND